MLRPLKHIEEAFAYASESYPLCVVVVLRLRNGPPADRWRQALDELQRRHLILRSGIEETDQGYSFRALSNDVRIPLRHIERRDAGHWEEVAESELNTRVEEAGPLMRATLLDSQSGESELMLVLHHAMMDGVSARLFVHELLRLGNGEPVPPALNPHDQVAPYLFPEEFRRRRLARRLAPFLASQTLDELRFRLRGLRAPAPSGTYNRILHISLPEDVSRRIAYNVGRHGISLNSVLNAALLVAVRRRLYRGKSRSLMRALTFVDLRGLMRPIPPEGAFGCMISMLRATVAVEPESEVLDVARRLRASTYWAGKTGEVYLYAAMTSYLTRCLMKQGRSRLAQSAISFQGKLDLQRRYGSAELLKVHAWITNIAIGPELAAFGKILFGRLELDLTYMTSEISEEAAHELLSDVEVLLTELADSSDGHES